MNPRQHAENSAKLFPRRDASDYLAIHELIDFDKGATASNYSRFFLHHSDMGLKILEAIEDAGFCASLVPLNSDTSLQELFIQHLAEDYAEIPKFTDWLGAFNDPTKLKKFPTPIEGEIFLRAKFKDDELLKKLTLSDIRMIEGVLGLGRFTKKRDIVNKKARYCIFGHATGILLAEKILGEKIRDMWTQDLLKRYLGKKFGSVPTIMDYEQCLTPELWMGAPTGYDRNDVFLTKQRMEKFLKDGCIKGALDRTKVSVLFSHGLGKKKKKKVRPRSQQGRNLNTLIFTHKRID